MLGQALVRAFRAAGDEPLESTHAMGAIDSLGYVHATIEATQPDAVVNAAGVIPLAGRPAIDMIRANALGPHVLAAACRAHGRPLIHVSTDCVFSGVVHGDGHPLPYRDTDPMDAQDAYGRAKALGEPPDAVVLRTSFVGPQHGLWRWLREQSHGAAVEGWRNALWSGSTVDAVARAIVEVSHRRYAHGVYHLATDVPTRKLDVVMLLAALLSLDLSVRPVDEPRLNRALEPSAGMPVLEPFAAAIGRFVAQALA